MSPAGIDQWFGRCVEAAGLSSYTMHQLRHAAIDQVRRATGDLEIARLLARHENVSVTQDYLHSTIDDLRAAIDGMVEGSV
jgi:site-specific recombinase XerD